MSQQRKSWLKSSVLGAVVALSLYVLAKAVTSDPQDLSSKQITATVPQVASSEEAKEFTSSHGGITVASDPFASTEGNEDPKGASEARVNLFDKYKRYKIQLNRQFLNSLQLNVIDTSDASGFRISEQIGPLVGISATQLQSANLHIAKFLTDFLDHEFRAGQVVENTDEKTVISFRDFSAQVNADIDNLNASIAASVGEEKGAALLAVLDYNLRQYTNDFAGRLPTFELTTTGKNEISVTKRYPDGRNEETYIFDSTAHPDPRYKKLFEFPE